MIVNSTRHSRKPDSLNVTSSTIVSLKYPSHHLNTYDSTKEVMALDKRKCVKNGKGACVCVCRLSFLYTLYADGNKCSALTKRGTQWQQGWCPSAVHSSASLKSRHC